MAAKRKRFRIIIIILLFLIYFLLAARPVPREMILAPGWMRSLSSSVSDSQTDGQDILFPFILGSRFGYIDSSGQFAVNRNITENIHFSQNMWTEYGAQPEKIEIENIIDKTVIGINDPKGYPVLLDDRIFILGSDQNSLSEIDKAGRTVWNYEFGAPLTCIDAKAGLLLTGSLDGIIEIFDYAGDRIFHFAPGGSRIEIILGGAISNDGMRIGIISGIDQQRFILFERAGNIAGDYKVIYHEYLDTGFRRPVPILFIDEDRRVIYEAAGGIKSYSIKNRRGLFIPLDGEIFAIEESGDRGYLFIIASIPEKSIPAEEPDIQDSSIPESTDQEPTVVELKVPEPTVLEPTARQMQLIGIRFPNDRLLPVTLFTAPNPIFLRASFKSDEVFLSRNRISDSRIGDSRSQLIVGGGTSLISFYMEEK